MPEFIRVRSAGGPNHEYSVSTDEYAANADSYELVDDTPSPVAQAPIYFDLLEEGEPPRSGRGSGEKAWRDHAEHLGVVIADGASRDDIIAAVDQFKSNSSAPAAPQNVGGPADQIVGTDPNKENIS